MGESRFPLLDWKKVCFYLCFVLDSRVGVLYVYIKICLFSVFPLTYIAISRCDLFVYDILNDSIVSHCVPESNAIVVAV